ncbi:hypothetical protein [Gillisia sp. CAL575]|uniref:hypothetical protein n=1 Tax=Gillisia sp. CAL575 TaxID=985255 RepID=UPI0003AAD5E8|nr:hypothetical protein [Gillisia sp. CAL575]
MEVKDQQIFQIDSNFIKEALSPGNNIKIVEEEGTVNTQPPICVIYFSSNEIYYPNTESSFKNAILERNKYEWQNSKYPGASKHIFIRDIKKQWYIEGINDQLNSPEKLKQFLVVQTEGYKIYTIGSSAGGYAAVLFGSLLKADRVYAFNSQLDLNITLKKSNSSIDPLLYRYKDSDRSKYFKVNSFLINEVDYFYFQSCLSTMDIEQYDSVNDKEKLTKISFKTSNHGFPFLRHNIQYVFSLLPEELRELSRKTLHPFNFARKIDGIYKTIYIVSKAILKRIKKKLYDEKRHA